MNMGNGSNNGTPHIELRLLSQPRYLCGARQMVSAIAKRIGFGDLECSQIALAVDEALANIMKHGYEGRPDGPIWLRVWPISGSGDESRCSDAEEGEPARGLRIIIEDEAQQVDPSKIQSRDLAEIRPGGLGVHIIRHVMDECRYEKRRRKGMRLTLEKCVVTMADEGDEQIEA